MFDDKEKQVLIKQTKIKQDYLNVAKFKNKSTTRRNRILEKSSLGDIE